MKIGVCCGIDRAKQVKDAGYDYIEEHFTRTARLSDAEFEDLLAKYKEIDIPVYSTNCFFPGDFDLYNNPPEYFYNYVKTGFERVSKLGVKVCVVGSGKARSIPDGADKDVIKDKFVKLVSFIADVAKDYGITLVIEPLQTAETNFILTVKDGAEIAKLTGKDNVKALVDFYHFYLNNENDDGLKNADGLLYHAHIARDNVDRKMPTISDLPTVKKWKALLDEVNYTGNLSLEGHIDFEKDLAPTKEIVWLFKN
jgi:sugar phosphate isomerase/epimerase